MPSADHPTTLTAADGTRLALRRWPTAERARGTVLIVHGLGEHCGRYAPVAARLNAWAWDVVSYDQRGHGLSDGPRGGLHTADDLFADLTLVVDQTRTLGTPLVLLGHSMGGAIAARFVAERRRPIDALVMTSPALDPGLSAFQRLQLAIGYALVPDLALGNGLDPNFISHDAAVVRAYREDPLVHDRVTARLGRCLVTSGAAAIAAAPRWEVPTLLLYAGADRLVSPRGSDAFAAAAPEEPSVVQAERFDALYHEILNEGAAAAPVYARLGAWLASSPRASPRATA
jgi:alpha-beta hydrolase superfamily lysophospholipase